MKVSVSFRKAVVDVVSLLYILLFTYAAVSKLLDFEVFRIQLAQSPLLSSFASWIAWVVPLLEIVIAVMLCIPKTRLMALYAGFFLMVMFTVYIIIILNFSPFVPCSCGGILEKLGWKEHLIFNFGFCVIALPAIIWESQSRSSHSLLRPVFQMTGLMALGTSTVVALFIISEDMMHHRNNFTRRYPVHPEEFIRDRKISFNAYIAGTGKGSVYLGDLDDPLKIVEVVDDLDKMITHRILTSEPNRKFRNLRISVKPPYFFVSDGVEAFVLMGRIDDWKADLWVDNLAYFNVFTPIDSNAVAIRAVTGAANESIIGVMRPTGGGTVDFNKKLLDKQIDGFFDTDGKLLFNERHKKIVYVYLYRNEYIISDPSLQSKTIGKTIDTTSRANIDVAYIGKEGTKKIASPMRVVNKMAATNEDYLYVNSKLIGQFEERSMWDVASVVDVYNILNQTYMFSFYLYDKDGRKVSDFAVSDGKVYTLAGRSLTAYNLDPVPFEKNK